MMSLQDAIGRKEDELKMLYLVSRVPFPNRHSYLVSKHELGSHSPTVHTTNAHRTRIFEQPQKPS
jgi:hypothetical protein